MATEKRFERIYEDVDVFCRDHNAKGVSQLIEREDYDRIVDLLNCLNDENEQLKKELKRCRDWLNSDKNDYQLTLAFIKSKGYSLKDVLEYEKELEE